MKHFTHDIPSMQYSESKLRHGGLQVEVADGSLLQISLQKTPLTDDEEFHKCSHSQIKLKPSRLATIENEYEISGYACTADQNQGIQSMQQRKYQSLRNI